MKITGIICPGCNGFLYSRAAHDFRFCPCGVDIFVDGGMNYLRYGGTRSSEVKCETRDLRDVTAKAMYNDWNYGSTKYGYLLSKELRLDLDKISSLSTEKKQCLLEKAVVLKSKPKQGRGKK